MNDIHSLADGYVVGALDDAETRDFAQHLTGCVDCTREVAALRELTATLSEEVATPPPAELRARLLGAIAATPQESGITTVILGAGQEGQEETPAAVPATVTPIRPPAPAEQPARRRPSPWTVGLVAASLLAALGLGGWVIQSRQDLQDTKRDSQVVAAQNSQLTRLLAADDVELVRGEFADGGGGAVVLSASEGEALLVGRDLPPLPEDQVYEAWTIETETPAPAGTFTPDDGSAVHELPPETFDAAAVAVTVEPEGGSPAPTSEPIFVAELPS
jgi:Anti-sigma-K factor rskA